MAGNIFIKFEEIKVAESTHASHSGKQGWIQISDWSWDIESETSFLKGSGAAVGKPVPGTLSFSHFFDMASPEIMSRIVKGTHFAKVHIVQLKQTGDLSGKGQVFFGMTMESCFITKVSTKGGDDGIDQDVEMVFKTIAIGYKAQDDEKKGKLSDQKDFIWDISKMQTLGVTAANLDVK